MKGVEIYLDKTEVSWCIEHSKNIVNHYGSGSGTYKHNNVISNVVGTKGEVAVTKWLSSFVNPLYIHKHFENFLDKSKDGDIECLGYILEIKSLKTDFWETLGRMIPPKQLMDYVINNAIVIWTTTSSDLDDSVIYLKGWSYAKEVLKYGIRVITICENIWLKDESYMYSMDTLAEIISIDRLSKIITGVVGKTPRDYDQFFTKLSVSNECVNQLQDVLKIDIASFDCIIEPSFGNGSFIYSLLEKTKGVIIDKLKYFDIDATDETRRLDFLMYSERHENSLCLTIGNPPFGKSASLAISFFNKAAKFSSCIAFIVPRTFSKESVQRKLDCNFFLIREHILQPDSFTFENKTYNVPCVFQIWIHSSKLSTLVKEPFRPRLDNVKTREIPQKILETDDFEFVKQTEEPDIAIRRVGGCAGKIFENDLSVISKQSHFFVKIKDKRRKTEVVEKIKALDLEKAEVKFQTAGNPSISKSELCKMYLNK